jgi:kynureninase
MDAFRTDKAFAAELDARDPLAHFRQDFVVADDGLVYLDGNSLGRLPRGSIPVVDAALREGWGQDLIRGWNKGWWDAPERIGEKIATLIGAAPGQVRVSDSTSVDLFKLAAAALRMRPRRTKIVTDTLNFPSDLYIVQGLVELLGGYELVCIPSSDGDITPDLAALDAAIDESTALVSLSHVVFKSGYLYDMGKITELAHTRGALVLWDLCHSVGALPISLDACAVDLAVGCTYKYLNGGPGSPAFFYVSHPLQDQALSPLWGWWGQTAPFDFGLQYAPAPGVDRFLVGTQPMLSMLAMEASLGPTLAAGTQALREKSVLLTEYAAFLFDHSLRELGFAFGSPRDPDRRGSHISIRHAEGYRVNRALIEQMNVVPDFRSPDNIRLGFAPLYTSFSEVWEGTERIRRTVAEGLFEKYPKEHLTVT